MTSTLNDFVAGSVGIQITVTTTLTVNQLASATTKDIDVTKPDGTVVKWGATASGVTLIYTTIVGDLLQLGDHFANSHVVTADGKVFYGKRPFRFTVVPEL